MFGQESEFISHCLGNEMIDKISNVGFNPAVGLTIEGIGVHEESGDRGNGYRDDGFLGRRSIVVGIMIKRGG